jgi:ribonuclease BN (tRNA processing enzyme)
MQCIFSGVGEAFDERYPNTSLILAAGGASLLLDCGFTAAAAFLQHAENPLDLDAVCISHLHGDHYFGLPYLLTRSMEEGRTRDLLIVGPEHVQAQVEQAVTLAYASFFDKARFALRFAESAPGRHLEVGGCQLSFAPNDHPQPCLAVRVDAGGASLFYSGDGRPTPETRELARGCGLVVHEAYSLESDVPGHGTVDGVIDFARDVGAKAAALVHVQRRARRERLGEIRERLARATDIHAFLPEPGDAYTVQAGDEPPSPSKSCDVNCMKTSP